MVESSANITGGADAIKSLWQRSQASPGTDPAAAVGKLSGQDDKKTEFSATVKAIGRHLSAVDELQQTSDSSIKELLSGKNQDVTSVVAAVAKADMSFKLLIGIRNQLIEAYKQTMNMPL